MNNSILLLLFNSRFLETDNLNSYSHFTVYDFRILEIDSDQQIQLESMKNERKLIKKVPC